MPRPRHPPTTPRRHPPRTDELGRTGVGASRALVRGQVLPGVSVWDLVSAEGEERLYVVVPGNVGGPEALIDVLAALRR
ncbi:hypothetical protein BOH66_14480 [Microbacterium aurum]|uniref:Uncharacterized protein n=1 Tax=Microbacterium aurum TaxID=36805 RepID=A0A1P8UB19_9MICO|nr:hypothetical protein BOH66_14480 [Microbacterium aurum]